jgi:hypothetical protein
LAPPERHKGGNVVEEWKEQRAQARGEEIRAELKVRLSTGEAQSAAALYPQMPNHVSLSEVAFQLERLTDEGETTGEVGGVYRIAGNDRRPRQYGSAA